MKTCAKIFFMAMAAGMMLAGCAYPPGPAPEPKLKEGPRIIYDENGRPLWIPPSARKPHVPPVPPAGDTQSTTGEQEKSQEPSSGTYQGQTADEPDSPAGSAPRIGSAGSVGAEEEKAEDSHLLLAVSPLAVQAEQQMERGELDQAFATAERAVRIDPDNAKMWNLMARIQFKKENYTQAEQLARKSNLLAANDTDLQAVNWKLIAAVLSKNGQENEARKALQKAEDLEY